MTTAAPPTPELGYNRICNLEDFAHPQLRSALHEAFAHELDRFGPDFPTGHEYRKQWEVAMAVRTFRDHGLLDGTRDFLGIGAGNEPTIFYLTRHAHRVYATDLYVDPGSWGAFTDQSMLTEPERHWPFAWNPRRLVVQHMDAMDLRYEDASFDAVFSSSSIEHFGDFDAIGRSVDEIHRVLRPGGIFSVATEFLIEGPSLGNPGLILFNAPALFHHLLGERDWLPLSPVDLRLSATTAAAAEDGDRYMDQLTSQMHAQGGYFTFKLEFERYPQVAMHKDHWRWTSVHLAFRKPEQPSRIAIPRESARDVTPPQGSLGHSKVCSIEDFSHPQLAAVIQDLFAHERVRCGPDFPAGAERIDHWHAAMTVRSLADHGVLDGSRDIVGVGAGNGPMPFYLTHRAGRVFANDRYLDHDDGVSMITEPERHWPYPWNPRRLVAQHMDPLLLRHDDDTVDGVFASGLLERCSSFEAIRRAVAEMHRILKPGGVLALSTTYLVSGPPPSSGPVGGFTVPLLYDLVVDERPWALPSAIDFTVSPATLTRDSVVERVGDRVSTGIHLTLRKP